MDTYINVTNIRLSILKQRLANQAIDYLLSELHVEFSIYLI